MSAGTLRGCGVRVPCSTSNLGAGFDCIGLAFARYVDAGYLPGSEPIELRRTGTLGDLDASIEDDVLARAFTAELRRRGARSMTGTLFVDSTIPIGRGLGSSGAAAVAGVALAAVASGEPIDRAAILATAVRLEGHPDNAAPSLYGGLIAAAYVSHGAPRALRLPLSDRLTFVFAAPDVMISTERARSALPQHVPRSAAVRNLSRVAALLYGLANADADAIATGLNDELHVPYRLPLIPGGAATLQTAVKAGAYGATISGSGSGLIAVCPRGAEEDVLEAMLDELRGAGSTAEGFVAVPDNHGAQPRDIGTLVEALE